MISTLKHKSSKMAEPGPLYIYLLGTITFLIQLVVIGQLFTFGEMVDVMYETFNNETVRKNVTASPDNIELGTIAAVGSLQLVMFFATHSIVTFLTKIESVVVYLLLASVMWALGMFGFLAFPNLITAFIFQSLMVGGAGSFAYYSTIGALNTEILKMPPPPPVEKSQTIDECNCECSSSCKFLPLDIAMLGSGIGIIVFVAISQFYTMETVAPDGYLKWKIAYASIAGSGFGIFMLSAILIGIWGRPQAINDLTALKAQRKIDIIQYFTDKTDSYLIALRVTVLLSYMSIFVPFVYLVPYIEDIGLKVATNSSLLHNITEAELQTVTMNAMYILGSGCVVGKIAAMVMSSVMSLLTNQELMGIHALFVINMFTTAIILFCWLECKNQDAIYAFAFFYGLGNGFQLNIVNKVIVAYANKKKQPEAKCKRYQMDLTLYMAMGVGFSTIATSIIFDIKGSYTDVIITTGVFQIAAALLGLISMVWLNDTIKPVRDSEKLLE